jgi:hypothetical protein
MEAAATELWKTSYFGSPPLPQLSIALELCFSTVFGFMALATLLEAAAFATDGFFTAPALLRIGRDEENFCSTAFTTFFAAFTTTETAEGLARLLDLDLAAGALFMPLGTSKCAMEEHYSAEAISRSERLMEI